MPEALIASVARSPIGRAVKGSLTGVRPDDLAARMLEAAIDQVPQLDPGEIEDLYLGCGEPYDEQGANMARRVAVLAGLDGLPGSTACDLGAAATDWRRCAWAEDKGWR
jgi:acetyl-CoA C-acetyltransferase